MTFIFLMNQYYFILYLLLNITPFNLTETNNLGKLRTELTVCQHYSHFFENNNNSAKIVDVINGVAVNLLCQFCEDRNTYLKQTWYYKNRGLVNNKPNKIITGLANVNILPSKNLLIRNFSDSLSGIYTCEYTDEFMKGAFTYILDEVFDNKPKVGLRDEWQTYKHNELDKINDKFKFSNAKPFAGLRNQFNLLIELVTFWDDWGPCEPLGKQKGLRKRLAMCRLKTLPYKINKSSKLYLNNLDGVSRFLLFDKYGISCRSVKLNQMLPAVSRVVNIPDFEVIEACDIETNPKKYFGEKKIEYKHTIMKQIGENGHLNLICPEIKKYSRIEWYKNYVLLNSSFRPLPICWFASTKSERMISIFYDYEDDQLEYGSPDDNWQSLPLVTCNMNNIADSDEEPHLTIDSYNTLYILHATKNEEALYSCIVDGEHILLCDVTVVSKSRLLNREFIRYSIYLGFVLSLTLTCYCAGIFVAWHRRVSFADPLNLNKPNLSRRRVKNKSLFD